MMGSLLTLLLACSPAEWKDTTVRSSNGRFTLEVTARTLTLREGARAPKWTVSTHVSDSAFRVSDSGAWVAALHTTLDENNPSPAVTLYDATGGVRSVALLETLDEEERQWLQVGGCGLAWLHQVTVRGDWLDFDIFQGGNLGPTEGPGPTARLSLDARSAAITRGSRVPRPSISDLIGQHRAERKPGSAFALLRAKATLRSSRGARALCSFFGEFLNEADAKVRREAISALGEAACTQELASLGGPRGDESDLEQLELLERQDPIKASDFAMAALRAHSSVPLLRMRGVMFVIQRSPLLRWESVRLALADPDPGVVDSAVGEVARLPRSHEAFGALLQAARVASSASPRARYAVLTYLQSPRDPVWGQELVEAFEKHHLEQWPAAWVVVAGLAEKGGDRSGARALYERALPKLEADRPTTPYWADRELWCEAKLRLAQLAAEEGKAALALALAREVVTHGADASAAAPEVNRYAGGSPFRSARDIADELVKAGGAPAPKRPAPQDQIKQAQEQMKQMRELFQKRKDDAARKAGGLQSR